MTVIPDFNLDEGMTILAVANTPIFLTRRLREMAAPQRILKTKGEQAIFAALVQLAPQLPVTLEDAAERYFYLVSLSFSDDMNWVRKSRALNFVGVKWIMEMTDYLLKIAKSTTITNVIIPQNIVVGLQGRRDTTVNTIKIVRA